MIDIYSAGMLASFALSTGLVGFLLHRWLWRHVPKLMSAPTPTPIVDLGVSVITVVLVAAALVTNETSWTRFAYGFFAVAAVQLSVIDFRLHILPNVLVLPAGLIGLVSLTASAIIEARWEDLARAVIGSALLFLAYLALALISPKGLGMGDVKLAAVVGLYLAFHSWMTLLLGAAAGFLVGALAGVALLAARRARLDSAIPFGPSILGGAAFVLFVVSLVPGSIPG